MSFNTLSLKDKEKIFLLGSFKFFISFVYTLFTNIKEPLVMMSSGAGAEVLPVLKGWVVLPLSIAFVMFFGILSRKVSPTKLFFGIFLFFFLFLGFYNFVLRPHEAALRISDEKFNSLVAHWPYLKHFFVVYRDWVHALCFACIELYGQVVIFLIFWGVTNDLCNKNEAKWMYSVFIMTGCLGGLCGTELNVYVLKHGALSGASYDGQLLNYLFGAGLGGIFLTTLTYGLIYMKFYHNQEVAFRGLKKGSNMSFIKSVRYLLANRYLLAIAVMVIACGLSINLVDVTYKANLKSLFPSKIGYQLFTAKVTRWLQLLSAALAMFVGAGVMGYFGWRFSALIAPILIVGSGVVFFLTSKFKGHLGFLGNYGIQPITFVVYLGVGQTVLSKLIKYISFDKVKEMAYLGLDKETRLQGKGVVDLVGSRTGKSLSGYIHTGVMGIFLTPSVFDITHILMIFLLLIGGAWIWAIEYLHKAQKKNEAGSPQNG